MKIREYLLAKPTRISTTGPEHQGQERPHQADVPDQNLAETVEEHDAYKEKYRCAGEKEYEDIRY